MRCVLDGGYELDDDRARIDRSAVHRYLCDESYWARGRPRELMDGMIERASRVVGLYDADGEQVGFSRTVHVPDAGLAYLADVYVLAAYRGRGLGVELVRFSVEEGPYAGERWLLHTADAHALYRRFGFDASERLMERQSR